jgi:hypothetical protein
VAAKARLDHRVGRLGRRRTPLRQAADTGNPYALGQYPRTTNTLRLKLRRPSFLSTAEYNAGTLPPLPPKPPKHPPPPTPTPTPAPPPAESPPTQAP